MNPVKEMVRSVGNSYVRRLCENDFAWQKSTVNERPIEYRFALQCLTDARPKSVLDVGTGTTAWPRTLADCGYYVRAIDNVRDYWPSGMTNRHWQVDDVDITKPFSFTGRYDAITCISVMEHIVDHESAVRNMLGLLQNGGSLIITTPYNHQTHVPNVYKRDDALYGKDLPYICRSHSVAEIDQWQNLGAKLKRRELWRLFSGPVWATGDRAEWKQASETEPHQLGLFEFQKH